MLMHICATDLLIDYPLIATKLYDNMSDEVTPRQTHCNTLQHTATHCNTLQHTATHCTPMTT